MTLFKTTAFALALSLSAPALAEHHMASSEHSTATIVDLAVGSDQHGTLVAAVQAAGLAETLASPGPFTVFAPTDAGFAALPDGTVDTLLEPENRDMLTSVLTYHVVPGMVSATQLLEMIESSGGTAELTTVEGGTLTASAAGGTVTITDENDRAIQVTATDLVASNGVIHVTDGVLLPN